MTPQSVQPTAAESLFAHYGLNYGQGLLFAYSISANGEVRELSVEEADDALAASRGLVWVHLDLTTTPVQRWIETRDWLSMDAKELLLTREDRTQYRSSASGIAGILRDFHRELEAVDWRVGQLHFYSDPYRFITARRHPLAGLDRARQMVLKECAARSGIALLVSIIEALADLLDDAADDLSREIERIEDRIEQDDAQHLRASVGEIRKRAILFHRQIHSERRVMARLCAKPPAWFHDTDTAKMREMVDHLGATAEDLDTIEVRAKLLQDDLAAQLAEATNRNLYILSALSAVMLPMTLISGIFGMNLGGIPGANSPLGFVAGVAFIGLFGVLTLIILRVLRFL